VKFKIKKLLLRVPGFIWICRFLSKHHVRTLMYHRFIGLDNFGRSYTSTSMLDRQLKFISQNHRCISPLMHFTSIKNNEKLTDCPVVITIDDGYLDTFELAFPLFHSYKIPATVFIATGFVDGNCWFWWDKISFIIENSGEENTVRTIGKFDIHFDFTTVEGRFNAWQSISDIMRWLPNDLKNKEIDSLAQSFGLSIPDTPPRKFSGLTWDHVSKMRNSNISFAPHTVNHPILARVPDKEAQWEISESARRVTEKTGIHAKFFCYPQGGPADFSPVHPPMIEAAGMEACYIAYMDIACTSDLFSLPRYNAPNNWENFVWTMCGADYLFMRIQHFFGKRYQAGENYFSGQDSGLS